ncbi:MAG: hypothetical protein M1819_001233 [Sarea resinae]|nr:MAG: hypothetical protein M1819_001233 [Sarea resinae]
MRGSDAEFPLLAALGLYAADIRGDGNCLFNALSDQLYGTQNEHDAIRARVIAYMREHAGYYKQFVDVQPGGGVRRNPKRKNAGAYSSPVNMLSPTPEEIERVFNSHLQSMARGGTYGDNMEISAFSSAYDVDVKIYQRDFAYMVSGGGGQANRRVVHIAYHVWEHYSSIRNVSGPHTGPPEVKPVNLSPEDEDRQKEKLATAPQVFPWQVNVIKNSMPGLPESMIQRALEECKGHLDNAFSKLMDSQDRESPVSSTQGSSSVERDPDSDDEAYNGPNKKQDRRLSRATKTVLKEKEDRRKREMAAKFANHGGLPDSSQENSHSDRKGVRGNYSEKDVDDTEDEDWRPESIKDSDSTSDYSTTSSSQRGKVEKVRTIGGGGGGVRLTLKPPKPPSPTLNAINAIPKNVGANGSKTQQKQSGPQRKRISAREKKDMKKAAQKAAAKERKQIAGHARGDTNGAIKTAGGIAIAVTTKTGKGNTPVIEAGIKTLYI